MSYLLPRVGVINVLCTWCLNCPSSFLCRSFSMVQQWFAFLYKLFCHLNSVTWLETRPGSSETRVSLMSVEIYCIHHPDLSQVAKSHWSKAEGRVWGDLCKVSNMTWKSSHKLSSAEWSSDGGRVFHSQEILVECFSLTQPSHKDSGYRILQIGRLCKT